MTELERRDDAGVHVDAETLRYLGYDPADVATRALVLLADRYQLDPLLGEIRLIQTRNGVQVYVTRDGALTVAHRHPMFDGMEAEQRRNTTSDGWTAYVTVYRKDMSHPFRYGAQCKDSEPQAKAGNGPEMALARAERRTLLRAFAIRSDFYPGDPDAVVSADPVEVVVNLDGSVDMAAVKGGETAGGAPDGESTDVPACP